MDFIKDSNFNVIYADIRDFLDKDKGVYFYKLNKYIKAANQRGMDVDVVVGWHD